MRRFDQDFADRVLARLAALPPDARPRWGRMDRDQLIRHLLGVVRYSLGEHAEELPFAGNWITVRVLAPLMLNGLVRLPRHVRFGDRDAPSLPGDLDALRRAIDDYRRRAGSGDLEPPLHPYFGPIGVEGWSKLHVIHFEHHLRQFGA